MKIKENRTSEKLLIAFAVIITATILVIGYFDSPKYSPDITFTYSENIYFLPNAEEGKVDINNATLKELTELDGIGEVRAQEIIDYREGNGGFYSVEEILYIEKIPQSVYFKIKDKITVGVYKNDI